MQKDKSHSGLNVGTVGELKKCVLAGAIASGNSFAFHDLFSWLKEFPDLDDDSPVDAKVIDHLNYLLPTEEVSESADYREALELVEKSEMTSGAIPATVLEKTAQTALLSGKFSFAEDAYRLLGIKKEIVALHVQAGEHLLREDKPEKAAIAFFTAASLENPIGPHYQNLALELHSDCLDAPEKCVTSLPLESLTDAALRFLLPNESMSEKLVEAAKPDHKKKILATLAVCRDLDFPGLVNNLKAAVDAFCRIDNGMPDDYAPIASMLLGRELPDSRLRQQIGEFCFEHPIGALCICVRLVRHKPVLVPVLRDGKSVIESLLPSEFLGI